MERSSRYGITTKRRPTITAEQAAEIRREAYEQHLVEGLPIVAGMTLVEVSCVIHTALRKRGNP